MQLAEANLAYQDGRPDKANCTSGHHEPHGYQGLPKGSVRMDYQGNLKKNRSWGEKGAPIALTSPGHFHSKLFAGPVRFAPAGIHARPGLQLFPQSLLHSLQCGHFSHAPMTTAQQTAAGLSDVHLNSLPAIGIRCRELSATLPPVRRATNRCPSPAAAM